MSGNNMPRTFRERLALISGVDLEQLDGLETEERADLLEFEPNLARLIIGLEQLEERDNNDDPHVGFGMLQDEFVGQVGLNETPLTKALVAGQFGLAEKLILENTDVDYLNDGVHTCTPLNLSLTGKSTFVHKPRNLKIARLLIEHGANPNLRIPNHDLDITLTVPESPLELLLQYYLDLLKTFRNDKVIDGTMVLNMRCDELDEDLLDTIGLYGEEKPTSETLIEHAKQLLNTFLDRGGDVNLQSNQSGRTIFHMALCADVTDHDLIEKMIHLGALVNLTDVHGSTPFMDVLSKKNQSGGVALYARINNLGKRVLLDAQNCSGESALWRSLYNGLLDCTHLLLHEGALSSTTARVQLVRPKRPSGRMRFFQRRQNVISSLPAILAPILGDSPVYRSLGGTNKFNIKYCNQAILQQISPLVDDGWFCTSGVEYKIHDLITSNTEFEHLCHDKVFQEFAMIPLLFGEVSAGLRQKCLRKILYSILFEDHPDVVLKSLFEMTKPKEVTKRHSKKISKTTNSKFGPAWADIESEEGPGDSACVVSSVLSDTTATTTDQTHHDVSLTGMTLSEPEMRRSTSTPQPLRPRRLARRRPRRFRVATFDSVSQRTIDDNWLLRQNPDYLGETSRSRRRRNAAPSRSLEGIEIEVSRDDEDEEDVSTSGAAGPPTVVRIHRLLRQTNDMLERLQTDFDNSLRHSNDLSPDKIALEEYSISDESENDCQNNLNTVQDLQNQSSIMWQGLQNDLALRGIDLLPMTNPQPRAKVSEDQHLDLPSVKPEIDNNSRKTSFPKSDDVINVNTSSDECIDVNTSSEMKEDECAACERLCLSADLIIAKAEAVILEALINDSESRRSDVLDVNLCDRLCQSADALIAKTDAMMQQLQSNENCNSVQAESPSVESELPASYSQSELLIRRDDQKLKTVTDELAKIDESNSQLQECQTPNASSLLAEIDSQGCQKTSSPHTEIKISPVKSKPDLETHFTLATEDSSDLFNSSEEVFHDCEGPDDEDSAANEKASGVKAVEKSETFSEEGPSSGERAATGSKFHPALLKLMQFDSLSSDDDDSSVFSIPVVVRTQKLDSPILSTDSDISSSQHSSDDEGSNFQPSPTDESWGGGPFSLRHTLLAEARLRRYSNSLRSSTPATQESVIQRLDSTLAAAIAKKIGIPPGLVSCFELEMARLQLLLAVHRHRSIDCDRGCEGNDSNSSDDDEEDQSSESGESSWEFGSLSGPFSSATGVDLSSSLGSDSSDDDDNDSGPPYDPSVPSIPRILTSSSSEDGDDDIDSLDFRLGHLDERADEEEDDRSDWFSVVGDSEHASTSRYVQEKVDPSFNHSTDSDTDKSADESRPTGRSTLV